MSGPFDGPDPKRPSPPTTDESLGGDEAKLDAAPGNDTTRVQRDKQEILGRLIGRVLLAHEDAAGRIAGELARLHVCARGGAL